MSMSHGCGYPWSNRSPLFRWRKSCPGLELMSGWEKFLPSATRSKASGWIFLRPLCGSALVENQVWSLIHFGCFICQNCQHPWTKQRYIILLSGDLVSQLDLPGPSANQWFYPKKYARKSASDVRPVLWENAVARVSCACDRLTFAGPCSLYWSAHQRWRAFLLDWGTSSLHPSALPWTGCSLISVSWQGFLELAEAWCLDPFLPLGPAHRRCGNNQVSVKIQS